MKVRVTIEEIISQKFEVEVSSLDNAYDEVRQMYKDGKLVLENPSLITANVLIRDDCGEGNWRSLRINCN